MEERGQIEVKVKIKALFIFMYYIYVLLSKVFWGIPYSNITILGKGVNGDLLAIGCKKRSRKKIENAFFHCRRFHQNRDKITWTKLLKTSDASKK